MTAAKRNVRAAMASARSVAGKSPAAEAFLPLGCPVAPLGKFGSAFYYLDASRQLVCLPGRDHSRLGILTLFDKAHEYLYTTWPRTDKDGGVTGWRPERAAEALIGACGAQGMWDPTDRERGRGAWPGERGELVLHTGQHVVSFAPNPNSWGDRLVREPGLIGRHVYPAAEDAGAPAEAASVSGVADDLLAMLETWNWQRPAIDGVLLLGWIGAAMIGGALDWRAIIWLTGDRGTGKSTLQKLLDSIFDGALLTLADTSEAYIRQTLRHQTLPVMLDEAESEEDNRKLNSIVKLARIAASGGKLGRGGSDHHAVEFTMRSAFLFGSILLPPLLGQDRSRIAVLEMGELEQGSGRQDVSREKWAPIGAQLRRRMVDGWGRWTPTLDWFRDQLATAGHARRGQDQLGTLLAAAYILLNDGLPEAATAGEWIVALEASGLSEIEDDARDQDRCAQYLLTYSIDPHRNGSRKSIAEWIRIAAGWVVGNDPHEANKMLMGYGLKVRGEVLLVANYHHELATLYQPSHWAGRSGSMGVWVQALRRLPGADRAGATYFGGPTSKATSVPLASILTRHDPDPVVF